MGSGGRGQLRPHFAGRSPPFLVAALCIGLCVLAVSYYTLSTQSSGTAAKLALSLEKNQQITSELEDCRSQLHSKEREFDQSKSDLEQVRKQLQLSQNSIIPKDTELKTLRSQTTQQKTELDECRGNESKLKNEAKTADEVDRMWRQKEEKWIEEKGSLQAQTVRLQQQLNKKTAAGDEVSNNNNADDEKSNPAAGVADVPDSGKAVIAAAVAVPPAEEANAGPAVAPKAKDEIGVPPIDSQ